MGHLTDVVNFLNKNADIEPFTVDIHEIFARESKSPMDLSDVKGQEHVKRAMEVAAAGGHNMIMIGPPGSGKTMLARRFPTILPLMTLEEASMHIKNLNKADNTCKWRLASVEELEKLFTHPNKKFFKNLNSVWSRNQEDRENIWIMDFNQNFYYLRSRTSKFRVLAVRDTTLKQSIRFF